MMNFLSSIIMAIYQYNFSNFASDGFLRVAFDPYLSIFGNFTWGIIFGFIGAGLYASNRSMGLAITYLVIVGIFMSIIFPAEVVAIFGLILAFLLATVFYIAFVQKQR